MASRRSPSRRVCLFISSSGPFGSLRQVELREMEAPVASDTWALSGCCSDPPGCLRRPLSFLVNLFKGLRDALLDWR